MEGIVSEIITQWGTLSVLILFAIWIIYSGIKDGFKSGKKGDNQKSPQVDSNALLMNKISDQIDRLEDKVDRLDINSNNINNSSRSFI